MDVRAVLETDCSTTVIFSNTGHLEDGPSWLVMWIRDVKREFFWNFFPGSRREFSTTWWCHTRDPELPMRPRLLARSCVLPSCKFAASRLSIQRHYAQLQQWAFDVHCIALSREQRIKRSFSQTVRDRMTVGQKRLQSMSLVSHDSTEKLHQ